MALAPGGSRPDPDPTDRTMEQAFRDQAHLSDLFNVKIAQIGTRLDGMDRATNLLSDSLHRTPSEIDRAVTHLRELHEEKFGSVATQFRERDVRTDQAAASTKIAVDAALQAAKEAVGEQNKSSALAIAKSETATTKQIDQLQVLIQTNSDATNDKINDIKARLDRGEGGTHGVREDRTERRADGTFVLAIVGTAILVGSVVASIMALVMHH